MKRKRSLRAVKKELDHWIPVREGLPEVGRSVLYYEPGRIVGRTCHDGRDWVLPHKSNVTHWMPLPEPPK